MTAGSLRPSDLWCDDRLPVLLPVQIATTKWIRSKHGPPTSSLATLSPRHRVPSLPSSSSFSRSRSSSSCPTMRSPPRRVVSGTKSSSTAGALGPGCTCLSIGRGWRCSSGRRVWPRCAWIRGCRRSRRIRMGRAGRFRSWWNSRKGGSRGRAGGRRVFGWWRRRVWGCWTRRCRKGFWSRVGRCCVTLDSSLWTIGLLLSQVLFLTISLSLCSRPHLNLVKAIISDN